MKVLLVVLRKEFKQFFRSAFLPKLCLMFPLMVMLVLPLITNMDVKEVGVVLVDNDRSAFSRRLATDVAASEYLNLVAYTSSYASAIELVERGKADVVLEIPAGYHASMYMAAPKKLRLSANSVNATKGTLGLQYVQHVLAANRIEMSDEVMMTRGVPNAVPPGDENISSALSIGQVGTENVNSEAIGNDVQFSILHLFNPTLNYRFFMIPALMIMLIVMLCGFLPALNIVGEKERGTIEQINVSPVGTFTFTLGKIIPYWIIGFVVLSIAVVIAFLVYDLAPAGNLLTLYAATGLFILVMSGLATIIANFSQNMQQVMLVMFFFVMVFILMSGLLTPVASMPQWAQNITYFIPARYYVEVMRATYLRGASLLEQWPSFVMLAAFASILLTIAVLTYKKQV